MRESQSVHTRFFAGVFGVAMVGVLDDADTTGLVGDMDEDANDDTDVVDEEAPREGDSVDVDDEMLLLALP